ncbi:MAG: DNA mismatch repair protein MutS [Syntrophomonadaceae bacterium]|jgi:DNA mismatch repair protein MutS|nr:DNA mismatch repair protein MutS [Syntrophomonadaceae bacterium]
MIEQYLQVKEQHQDCILFFRLGDFYEMFFEDARLASRELEIVLTGRDAGQEEKVPMCGIPYHSANNYIARLINRGYRIAVCEQVEDPKAAKGIVKREVTRIITPGTIMDDNILSENQNNYLAAVVVENNANALAYIDVSTGDFWVSEFTGEEKDLQLQSELLRLSPAEVLINNESCLELDWQKPAFLSGSTALSNIAPDILGYETARDILLRHFEVHTLDGFGLKEYKTAVKAAAAVVNFLNHTQKVSLKQVGSMRFYQPGQYLELDYYTRRNLELTASMRDNKREGSLLGVLDSCCTSMGKRLLRQWIEQPLKNPAEIEARLDGVEELKNQLGWREELKLLLDRVYDLERIAGKIGSELANARDLLALKSSLRALQELPPDIFKAKSRLLQKIAAMDKLQDIYQIIDKSIYEEAALSLKEGGIIKSGYNSEIDELKDFSQKGSAWLMEFEAREKERSGIKYLKVGFNKVFGYYLEVSKSNLDRVPADYIRKQTLVNTERFISEELKNYEDKILGARERLYALEYEEFMQVRKILSAHIKRILDTARQVAVLDVLFSLSQAAYLNNYVRPLINSSQEIQIKSGRHPVVEKNLEQTRFVPNDTHMGGDDKSFAIITGPNMGGKSTYMRQVALLVLMAQMGSFVPATSARIGIVDKIFTRVGASDDLAAGQSTFMVEMVEVSNILHNAGRHSLIILDEIGRGTSTYDGMSIARSVSEFILEGIKARTMFATHYHELTDLSDKYPQVVNLSVSVHESEDTVVFLKKVLPGKADKSYGIQVAKLAGLPRPVIERAQEILLGLETSPVISAAPILSQPSLFTAQHPILSELEEVNINGITPLEAINFLFKWKQELIKKKQ